MTNYSFTIKELLNYIFKKKKCPNCDSEELSKYTHKKYKGLEDFIMNGVKFKTKAKTYEGIIIYECKNCKRKYTLEGLDKNVELEIEKLKIEENRRKELELKDEETPMDEHRGKVASFFKLVVLVMFLILISIAIQERNFLIMIIATPIILVWYGITRLFTK
ncbi:MAG: hypothetical protein FH751_06510 [Firmicutes bacterium]|nr:hypothetical protein [Bacillota bacterium]